MANKRSTKTDTVMSIRVPVSTHKRIVDLAKRERRQVGVQALVLIEESLEVRGE